MIFFKIILFFSFVDGIIKQDLFVIRDIKKKKNTFIIIITNDDKQSIFKREKKRNYTPLFHTKYLPYYKMAKNCLIDYHQMKTILQNVGI